MEFYIRETQKNGEISRTAGIKARDDIERILSNNNIRALNIPSNENQRNQTNIIKKIAWHFRIKKVWEQRLHNLSKNDTLYIQFPIIEHTIFQAVIFKNLIKRGVKIILFIHDLEILRVNKREDISLVKKIRLWLEEKSILNYCSKIIVHNSKMENYITKIGIPKNRLVNLEIFDYLIADFDSEKANKRVINRKSPIIIAGNLHKHKSEYIYKLPSNLFVNLYGIGYQESTNEHLIYQGAFQPDDLPYKLSGSFGLVWDGISSKSCQGAYGNYLRINNPHKTSLYLASGIPVIIWKEAALAEYILDNNCGLLIDSLYDIEDKIKNLSDAEYLSMKKGAEKISGKLRNGFYTKKAILLSKDSE